ncbi:hypothetical protein COO60DRAFT_1552809 [Scenedesmus sp. NREL 46B-D3]|nr:hypothetical protein COO60DRAFT_1552809 [Scenedesmus sp. NREL 46B-D3]
MHSRARKHSSEYMQTVQKQTTRQLAAPPDQSAKALEQKEDAAVDGAMLHPLPDPSKDLPEGSTAAFGKRDLKRQPFLSLACTTHWFIETVNHMAGQRQHRGQPLPSLSMHNTPDVRHQNTLWIRGSTGGSKQLHIKHRPSSPAPAASRSCLVNSVGLFSCTAAGDPDEHQKHKQASQNIMLASTYNQYKPYHIMELKSHPRG